MTTEVSVGRVEIDESFSLSVIVVLIYNPPLLLYNILSIKERCEYSGGCPIEPLVAQQAKLMEERDRLYFSVRETNNRQEVDDLIARAQAIDRQIGEIEERKNRIHPCKYCPYQ